MRKSRTISGRRTPISRKFRETPRRAEGQIFKESGRIKEDESGIPTPDGPFAYNTRMEEGKQYPVLVRTPRDGGRRQCCSIAMPKRARDISASAVQTMIRATGCSPGSPTGRARKSTR